MKNNHDHRGFKSTRDTIICIFILIIFASAFVGLLINNIMHIISGVLLVLIIIATIAHWINSYKKFKK